MEILQNLEKSQFENVKAWRNCKNVPSKVGKVEKGQKIDIIIIIIIFFFFSGNLFGNLLACYVQLHVQPNDLLLHEQQVSFLKE